MLCCKILRFHFFSISTKCFCKKKKKRKENHTCLHTYFAIIGWERGLSSSLILNSKLFLIISSRSCKNLRLGWSLSLYWMGGKTAWLSDQVLESQGWSYIPLVSNLSTCLAHSRSQQYFLNEYKCVCLFTCISKTIQRPVFENNGKEKSKGQPIARLTP